MKLRALSLLVLLATLATTAGTINKTYNFSPSQVEDKNLVQTTNTESDYVPMMVEGKTWWQSTERWPNMWKREHYFYIEIGFTIGSEVEIDGVTWNKLYISHYRDGVYYIDGVKWNEDESLLGYIREDERKVYYLGDYSMDNERYERLFGEVCGAFIPMYPVSRDKELIIYDFNKQDFHIGHVGDVDDYVGYGPHKLKYVSEEVVNNSGREYRRFNYTHEEGYAAEGEETYFIEGIGMPKSIDNFRACLFFLPMVNMERTALLEFKLRYVTDKDFNILYEQEGGTKLWDEMAGVSSVSTESSCDKPVWYNLQGIKVAEPSSPGIYIRKMGSQTEKVVVK